MVQVVLYDHGNQTILNGAAALQLQNRCEELFSSAKTTLLLVVTPRLIEGIKNNEVALEVRYADVRTTEVLGKRIDFTRLLFPLSGRFEDVVFYAGSIRSGTTVPEFASLEKYHADAFVYVAGAAQQVSKLLNQFRKALP